MMSDIDNCKNLSDTFTELYGKDEDIIEVLLKEMRKDDTTDDEFLDKCQISGDEQESLASKLMKKISRKHKKKKRRAIELARRIAQEGAQAEAGTASTTTTSAMPTTNSSSTPVTSATLGTPGVTTSGTPTMDSNTETETETEEEDNDKIDQNNKKKFRRLSAKKLHTAGNLLECKILQQCAWPMDKYNSAKIDTWKIPKVVAESLDIFSLFYVCQKPRTKLKWLHWWAQCEIAFYVYQPSQSNALTGSQDLGTQPMSGSKTSISTDPNDSIQVNLDSTLTSDVFNDTNATLQNVASGSKTDVNVAGSVSEETSRPYRTYTLKANAQFAMILNCFNGQLQHSLSELNQLTGLDSQILENFVECLLNVKILVAGESKQVVRLRFGVGLEAQ